MVGCAFWTDAPPAATKQHARAATIRANHLSIVTQYFPNFLRANFCMSLMDALPSVNCHNIRKDHRGRALAGYTTPESVKLISH